MNIKEKLQIILITYNRQRHLRNTLEALFSMESPVRDLSFTIFDNASDDGTNILCTE
jgi:GT2 family glycosyltransferase